MSKKKAPFMAGCIIWQEASSVKDIQILVVNVDSEDQYSGHLPPTTKFPGGDAEPEDEGNPQITASRELKEETGLEWLLDARPTEICRKEVSKNHFRIWYALLLSECGGLMRVSGTRGKKGRTSAPYWASLKEARDRLHPNHLVALDRFEERLVQFYRIPE